MAKQKVLLGSIISLFSAALLLFGTVSMVKRTNVVIEANGNPYVLDAQRSINASELANGQATYNTTNGNPIVFKFDSLKAETNNNGIMNVLTGGTFYNDTIINGVNRIDVTLSGGSATITYGNNKNNLVFGGEALNTNGNDDVAFRVDLTNPSNYFKLDFTTGPSLLKNMKIYYSCVSSGEKTPLTILFQGDSITDSSRDRVHLEDLGGGYASMVAKRLEEEYGEFYDFTFINRAHSGWNLIDDWNAGGVNHYEEEFYRYNPDITTVLIGYNDIIDYMNAGGVSDDDFESCYRELLQGLTTRGIKPICLAPFYIEEEKYDYTRVEFAAKRQIVSDLATEFNTSYIDMKPYMMQAVQDGAYKMELFGDLTHPWAAGCRIITELVVDKIAHIIDASYHTPVNIGEYVALTPSADNSDDYTNKRAFLTSSHGILEYDDETYYNTQDFASSHSVKMTNELVNPDQSNAYVRTLFDFHEDGKMDLTSGTLKVNIKVDNCLPIVSFRAFCDLSSSAASHISTSYSVNLDGTSRAVELGNGWYQVTVNLSSWAASQTNTALANAIAVEIALSKGENASARQTYGVIGDQDSYMWMDNLIFNLVPTGDTRGVEFVKGYATTVTPISLTKTINIDFKFTTAEDTHINFMLGDGWNSFFGYYQVNGNGTLANNYSGVSIRTLVDGYYRVTLVLNELTNVTGTLESVNLLYIHSTWTNAEGFVDFNPNYDPGSIRGVPFNSADGRTDASFGNISLDQTINIDFKFTSASSTCVQFILGDDWNDFFGYYKVNGDGTLGESYDGVTINPLEDGYFRVTIVLSELTKKTGNPTKINLFYMRPGWTTASGYVDFNATADVPALRGATFGEGNNYSLSVPSTALDQTINIDFKFTSASNTYVNFALMQDWGNFFGCFQLNANGSLNTNYDGVSLTLLEDGYFRVTLVLSQLTRINNGDNTNAPEYISHFFIRGNWTTGAGYVDYNPAV